VAKTHAEPALREMDSTEENRQTTTHGNDPGLEHWLGGGPPKNEEGRKKSMGRQQGAPEVKEEERIWRISLGCRRWPMVLPQGWI